MRMQDDMAAGVTKAHAVETSLSMLNSFHGLPDQGTVQKVFENLDRMRGIQVFLNALAPVSVLANIEGLKRLGCDSYSAVIHGDRVDSGTPLTTPKNQAATLRAFMDLREGPLVLEIPPGVIGLASDAWMRCIVDLGLVGPDEGKGGKYLLLPPGHRGVVPSGFFVARSCTYKVWLVARGLSDKGDNGPAVQAFKEGWKVYPLLQAAGAPGMKFINEAGPCVNTPHSVDFGFYEEVDRVIQEEPADAVDPRVLGQLAAIGIAKGKPFAPDARMKKVLVDAAGIGNATARARSFKPGDEMASVYLGKSWFTAFACGSHGFIQDNVRLLDAQTVSFYIATGITPGSGGKVIGDGSQYAVAMVDADGDYLDGGNQYRLNLPANATASSFWSIVSCDTQTRLVLQTDQRDTALTSNSGTVESNHDGSVDVWFGPTAPAGKEGNWVQTVPGKGWFTILRLYGALEPWFDKTWRPGEIERIK